MYYIILPELKGMIVGVRYFYPTLLASAREYKDAMRGRFDSLDLSQITKLSCIKENNYDRYKTGT